MLETAKREVQEETGVEIEPLEVFQVYDWIIRDDAGDVLFHYVVHYVRARYASGEIAAGDDAKSVRWVSAMELEGLRMHPFARRTALRLL